MPAFTISGATSVSAKTAPGGSINWGGGSTGNSDTRPTDDASLLAGINSLLDTGGNPALFAGAGSANNTVSGTWSIRFGFGLGDNVISLDGNPAISFNSLPSGITILTATLKIQVKRYPNVTQDPTTPTLFFQRAALTESTDLVQSGSLIAVTKSFIYDFSLVSSGTFLNVISDGFGIRVPFTANQFLGQEFFNARIDGTYIILSASSSWTIPNSTNVRAGDVVTINGISGLDGVTGLHVQRAGNDNLVSSQDFISQSPTQIQFYFPEFGNFSGTVYLYATGDGIQFSGLVLVGSLTVIFSDASGIYVLVPFKGTDTIYDRTTPGATKDINIVDPFIKTAFLP